MKPVTIFGFAGSTYTRTARMVCLEKAIPYELAPLEFGAESHRARHPFLKMPTLEHDGTYLFETLAIASYIDAIGSGASLRPRRPEQEAVMLQWISVAIDYLYRDLVAALLDSKPPEGTSKITAAMDILDATLRRGSFLAGEALSLADLFVAPMIGFAIEKTGVEPGPRRDLSRWWNAVRERRSYRETAS